MEYNTICWRHSTALILIISSKSQEKTRVNDFLLKKCHQLFPRSDIHETVSRKKLCRQFWSIYYKTNFQGNSSYFLPRLNSREVYIIVPEWGLKQLSNIRRKKNANEDSALLGEIAFCFLAPSSSPPSPSSSSSSYSYFICSLRENNNSNTQNVE